MKPIIHSLMFVFTTLLGTTGAFAGGTVCTNADRSLTYSYGSSDGGMHWEMTVLQYKKYSYRYPDLAGPRPEYTGRAGWHFRPTADLLREVNSAGSRIILAGTATGFVFDEKGQHIDFNEWVICESIAPPHCSGRCPGHTQPRGRLPLPIPALRPASQ